jgi:PPOX class probable F420-dependent enzyme
MATSFAGTATTTDPATAFASFARQWTVLLTTYWRDGTPVGTPVSIAVEGERAFFRTYDKAWKAKRLHRNPAVTIAPSTVRGKPTGPAIHARARLLGGDEATHAARALARKHPLLHGILVPLAHRLCGYITLHDALTA